MSRRITIIVSWLLLGCTGGRPSSTDGPGVIDAGVDRPTSIDAPDGPGSLDARDAPFEAGEHIGVCELLRAIIQVQTADGTASIATVQTDGLCMVVGTSCAGAPPDGGVGRSCEEPAMLAAQGARVALTDAGGSGCAQVTVQALHEGTCVVRVTSLDGQSACARIEITRVTTDRSCRDDYGRVHMNVPALRPAFSTVPVEFSTPDAGAGDAGS